MGRSTPVGRYHCTTSDRIYMSVVLLKNQPCIHSFKLLITHTFVPRIFSGKCVHIEVF